MIEPSFDSLARDSATSDHPSLEWALHVTFTKRRRVHWQTVLDLIHKGILPAAKIGRSWVLLESDVIGHLTKEVTRQTAARLGQHGGPKPKRKR